MSTLIVTWINRNSAQVDSLAGLRSPATGTKANTHRPKECVVEQSLCPGLHLTAGGCHRQILAPQKSGGDMEPPLPLALSRWEPLGFWLQLVMGQREGNSWHG